MFVFQTFLKAIWQLYSYNTDLNDHKSFLIPEWKENAMFCWDRCIKQTFFLEFKLTEKTHLKVHFFTSGVFLTLMDWTIMTNNSF